ncbi:hypothetical protein B0H21DRAFT_749642 [Amylocystis lapponica]|nr:hypothetical protein B0H21DRAFT_749642 [Amylocystis lapponica]
MEDAYYATVTFEVAVSATCFLVWDTVINLSDEVEFIWQARRSWIKWTYVFVRHFPYLAQGSILTLIAASYTGQTWTSTQCRDWIIYQLTAMEALTVAVEAVLIIRVYAMYNRSPIILAIILFLFLAEVTAMVAVLALTIPKMTFTAQCIITSTPTIFTSYWLFSLAFETILFGLTLVKFFGSVSRYLGRHSVFFVLVRDGTWAFAIIFVIMLLNTLMYHLVKNPSAGICFFWELSVMSFAGSHVLLNLRRLSFSSNRPSTTLRTNDSLHFSSRPAHTTGICVETELSVLNDATAMELQTVARHDTASSETAVYFPT